MTRFKPTRWNVTWVILVASACANVPRSSRPAEFHRSIDAPFDAVFDAALQVAGRQDGAVITADRHSGILSYRLKDPQNDLDVFVNLYIQPGTSGIVVLASRRARGGAYIGEVGAATLEQIADMAAHR